MSLKSKQNILKTIFLIILVLGVVLFLNRNEEISISKPIWECEYKINRWECKITLELTNNSGTHKLGKLSLRGVGFKPGKGPSVSLAEDKIIEFELNGRETITIQDVVFSKRKPETIKAIIIELK